MALQESTQSTALKPAPTKHVQNYRTMEDSPTKHCCRSTSSLSCVQTQFSLQNSIPTNTLNQSGFVTIFSTLIMGLLISSSLAVLALSWFLVEKQKLQKNCQSYLLKSQQALLDGGLMLRGLNPTVYTLILQKKFYQRAIAKAPTPALKSIALIKLGQVLTRMVLTRKKQVFIEQTSEFRARGHLLKLKLEMHQQTKKIAETWRVKLPSPRVQIARPKIMLRKKYLDMSLPTYELPNNYIYLQTLEARYSLRAKKIFPKWLRSLQTKHFFWLEQCHSHPEKGGRTWYAQIGKGKSLQKHSSLY